MSFIFVVEDEFDIQELLKNYLEEAGYQVLCASDGVEAINLYEREKEKIDLVLLDVMLPKIDGFGVLELIRKGNDDLWRCRGRNLPAYYMGKREWNCYI